MYMYIYIFYQAESFIKFKHTQSKVHVIQTYFQYLSTSDPATSSEEKWSVTGVQF